MYINICKALRVQQATIISNEKYTGLSYVWKITHEGKEWKF